MRRALGRAAIAAVLAWAPLAAGQPGRPPTAPATDQVPGPVTLGVRLGGGVSDLTGLVGAEATRVEASSARVALAVGGLAVAWVGAFGVQGEAMLARRGARVRYTDLATDAEVAGELELTYLDLGVLARVQPNRSGELRPFAVLGPALAISIDSGGEVDGAPFVTTALDVALIAGVGLGFGPPRRGFTAEIRVLAGLRDVSDETDEEVVVRNRALLALVGFEL